MNIRRFPPGGQRPEPPRPLESRRLLDEAAGELARRLGRPLALQVGALPRVTARPGRLLDVFRRALAEATEGREVPSRPVEVGCHLSEGHLRFFVRFLPQGMPACLAPIRELVELEGGKAWVENDDPGSTLWFSLPADPVPA